MSIIAKPGSPAWNYDFEIAKSRYQGATEFLLDDPADPKRRGRNFKFAQEWEGGEKARIRALLAKGIDPKTGDAVNAVADLHIRRTFDDYFAAMGQDLADAEKIRTNLNRLADYFAGKKIVSLYDIDDQVIADLMAWRRQHRRWDRPNERLITAATVNRTTICTLQPVFTWVKDTRLTPDRQKIRFPHEPTWVNHLLPEPKERVRELRQDENEALVAAETDPDYEAWRQFSLRSGLRLDNSLLRWRDVDLKAGTVTLIGKGDQVLVLPLSPEAVRILRTRQGHHSEWVFTFVAKRTWTYSHRGHVYKFVKGRRYPITYRTAQGHWRDLRARAAEQCPSLIDPAGRLTFRIHDNRHTAASRWLRTTGNLKLTQRALGHANIATTAKYAHVMDEEVRAALAEADKAYPAPTTTRQDKIA